MNVELLRTIKKHILEEPLRLDMGEWFRNPAYLAEHLRPPCGTVGCIAGWTCALTIPELKLHPHSSRFSILVPDKESYFDVEAEAEGKLGITDRQATRLFYVDSWPEKFATAHDDAQTPEKRAKVTAKRIDHFIKTKGAE